MVRLPAVCYDSRLSKSCWVCPSIRPKTTERLRYDATHYPEVIRQVYAEESAWANCRASYRPWWTVNFFREITQYNHDQRKTNRPCVYIGLYKLIRLLWLVAATAIGNSVRWPLRTLAYRSVYPLASICLKIWGSGQSGQTVSDYTLDVNDFLTFNNSRSWQPVGASRN